MNVEQLGAQLFRTRLAQIQRDTDRLFFGLLLAQWALAIGLALTLSPFTWSGRVRSLHPHVQLALLAGGLLNALPLALLKLRPGSAGSRPLVAVVQMMWSALLIELCDGRIETHFHVFGSLALLAFYRDNALIVIATLTVMVDHLLRGLYWPESIYGVANPEWWRFLEHGAWVLFESSGLALGITQSRRDMRLLAEREAAMELTHIDVEQQVEQRTTELEQSLARFRSLVENTNAVPFELDAVSGELLYIAPQASRMYGLLQEELSTLRLLELVHPEDRERVNSRMQAMLAGEHAEGEVTAYRVITADGRLIHVRTSLSVHEPGAPLRGITLDVSKEVKMEAELRQAQKLESLGKVAAGVAHEINTPLQFVGDSVHFVKSATRDLLALHERHQAASWEPTAERKAELAIEAEAFAQENDFDSLIHEVPRALDLALDGLTRVGEIVRSMKELSHPSSPEKGLVNLNQAVLGALTIARGEYKHVAELTTELAELPPVRCVEGDIQQVVINIVVNATHAIAARKLEGKGEIRVRTRAEHGCALIEIEDTGGGIPAHLQDRVFEPFFTTKEVGSGTGQGLSIARTIVVDRHQGALWFASRPGVGTTFFVRLPTDGQGIVEESAA